MIVKGSTISKTKCRLYSNVKSFLKGYRYTSVFIGNTQTLNKIWKYFLKY